VNTQHGPVSVAKLVADDAYLHGAFIKTVQVRGAAVIKARKLSSAMSAAKAICDHLHVWCARGGLGVWLFWARDLLLLLLLFVLLLCFFNKKNVVSTMFEGFSIKKGMQASI
jgi:hypothetical protein